MPTLLIVGGQDPISLDLTMRARDRLHCPNRLMVIPGAGHLFEEPGPAQLGANVAAAWFIRHVPRSTGRAGTTAQLTASVPRAS